MILGAQRQYSFARPSYPKPAFTSTLPEAGLLTACDASMRLMPTCSNIY